MKLHEASEQISILRYEVLEKYDERNEKDEKKLDALTLALVALDKITPAKPVKKYRCPLCNRALRAPIVSHTTLGGKKVSRKGDAFCSTCGKAIDWGENE